MTQQDKDLTEEVAKLTREIHALLSHRGTAALGRREIRDERRRVERLEADPPATSSLVGRVPSRKSPRRISPVAWLRHQSSPTSRTRYVRSCAERIHARR